VLSSQPTAINVAFLESRFAEMQEFRSARAAGETDEEPPASFDEGRGVWVLREGIEDRIRETFERSIPNEDARRAALVLLAFAIDNADVERADAWYVKETPHGLRVMTGRLLACEVTRSSARVSVIGPVTDEVRSATEALRLLRRA
jgi:hypothetical protein